MPMEEVEQDLLLQDLDHDAIATAQSRELINSGLWKKSLPVMEQLTLSKER